jgi:ABC-type nitrate/sulfonate/bicarbonate transport system permease component
VGLGARPGHRLLLVAYASFWQVLIRVLYGVADVDAVAHDTAGSYELSAWSRIWLDVAVVPDPEFQP